MSSTKDEKKVKELIRLYIKNIKEVLADDLAHNYKICLSKSTAKEKALYKPLIIAIEKERKSRGIEHISAHGVALTIGKKK